MMKVNKYLNPEWVVVASLFLSSISLVIGTAYTIWANNRTPIHEQFDIAKMYIAELEDAIRADDTVIGDVCGGDGYQMWHELGYE